MIVDEALYLEHYGVKGMRWGVRRRSGLPSRRKAAKAHADNFVKEVMANPEKERYVQANNRIVYGKGKDFTAVLLGEKGKVPQKELKALIKETAKGIARNEENQAMREEIRAKAERRAKGR